MRKPSGAPQARFVAVSCRLVRHGKEKGVSLAANPFSILVGRVGFEPTTDGYKNFSLMLQALKSLPDFELHCI
ncbi:hypothetical protein, partial [uncultured Thiodictyon sp.]|uniref:hypothetical protein n=1 Tax=uncultured Thiodictyon sp. TaxID=1846217 RepID=UPI0025D2A80D